MITFFHNLVILTDKYGEDRVIKAVENIIQQEHKSIVELLASGVVSKYPFMQPDSLLNRSDNVKYDRSFTTPQDIFIHLCLVLGVSFKEFIAMGYDKHRVGRAKKRMRGLDNKFAEDRQILENIDAILAEYKTLKSK